MFRFTALVIIFSVLMAGEPLAESNAHSLRIIKQDKEEIAFTVELAQTPQELARGLMHRQSMPHDHGMLFLFEDEEERGFWMKNTYIPLDMIFIRKDGTIHHIHENAIPHDLTTIRSRGPVMAVLEVNGGVMELHGIQPGDRVFHAAFQNMLDDRE